MHSRLYSSLYSRLYSSLYPRRSSRSYSRLYVGLFGLLCIAAFAASSADSASAQMDSNVYVLPPRPQGHVADSLDSLYRVRRAQVDQWAARQRAGAVPPNEGLGIYAEIGGLIRTSPADLNQFFAERAFRPDPNDDRSAFRSVDRAFILGAQFRLSRSWGIFVQYEYSGTVFNTIIDSAAPNVKGLEESMDLTEHSFVTGGMMMLYSSQFYRLRALGGLGAVYASTTEEEPASVSARSASAVGVQLNFDLVNDFRIADWGNALIDIMTRTTSTGELKTSAGETIDKPFGRANRAATLSPHASKTAFGFAVGLMINL
jgi:hypothetical protein